MVLRSSGRLRTLCAHVVVPSAEAASAQADVPKIREELRGEPLHMPPPPASVPEMAAQFVTDGFLHLPGCLSAAETVHLRERSDALWRSWGNGDFDGSRRSLHAVCGSSYDTAFLLPLDKEPTCSVAGAALGPGFALFGDSVWNNYQRPEQQLHIDYQQYEAPADDDDPAAPHRRELAPLRFLTAHYYLEDVYEGLGPTKFIAGSHMAGRPPRASDQVRKRHFLSHLYIKCIILPRQARDKHRENSKKGRFLAERLSRHARPEPAGERG